MSSDVIQQQPGSQSVSIGNNDEEEEDYMYDDSCCSCQCCKVVCYLFCCPPIPSYCVAKQAFQPPAKVEYQIGADNELTINGKRIDLTSNGLETKCAMIPTKSGNEVASYLLQLPNPRYTILFSHGNAVDIGQMFPNMVQLALLTRCSIMTYDYSGYGRSTGRARELNQYDDIDAVWKHLTQTENISGDRIILYGTSIGSSPSTHHAKKLCQTKRNKNAPQPLGGLVLQSPVLSGIRVLRPQCQTTIACDPFQNIKKIKYVTSPTLVIHGTRDEVVPLSHGETLAKLAPNSVEPLFIQDADHNDIELFPEYPGRLVGFLDELDAIRFSLTDS